MKVDAIAKNVIDVKYIVEKLQAGGGVDPKKGKILEIDDEDPDNSAPEVKVEQILIVCKTIEDLDENIEKLGIVKENVVKDGQDGYYCKVCFDGTKPKYSMQQPGVFLFDSSKDDTTVHKMSGALRHLKTQIKTHIESKIHQQKLEILIVKAKRQKERKSRMKTIGLNIFRTRYNGI